MSALKLTVPQMRELVYLGDKQDGHRISYSSNYSPVRKLLELGLVDFQAGKFGSDTYAITPEGRAVLAKARGQS